MSQSEIRVFHYQEGSSDKIWAICTKQNQTSTFTVWFGRRDTKLNQKEVPGDQTADSRIREKLGKGYVELSNMTIDRKSYRMVATDPSVTLEVIPSALWYRIKASRLFEVQNRIDDIEHSLDKELPSEAIVLRSLSLYQDVKQGKLRGSHELAEGPLGVLMLFSLRRFGKGFSVQPGEGPPISIADDFNNLLPDRFNDLSDYVVDSCKSYLMKNGFMSDLENRLLDEDHVLDVAKKNGVEHYTSIKAIKELAILVGCIDAPIDLSLIRPDLASAFF